MIGQDNVTIGLAANIVAAQPHLFKDMMVADPRPDERQPSRLQAPLEPDITHDRCDDAGTRKPPVFMPVLSDDCEDLVAVNQPAVFVYHDDRSASPSSAIPLSARRSRTFAIKACGAVEPLSRLMLRPFGSTPIEITSAPSSQSASGATR